MRILVLVSGLILSLSAASQPPAKPKAKEKPKVQDPLVLKVATTTGQGNKFAGTGGNKIYILVNGEPGKKYHLTNKNKPFQRGATDKFQLKLDIDPAEIESLRLVNESNDMWKCETITFQFFKAGKESKVFKHAPAQYLSAEGEKKALHAKPYIDFKMKVTLEEPKPKTEEGKGKEKDEPAKQP